MNTADLSNLALPTVFPLPKLDHLFDLKVRIDPVIDIGETGTARQLVCAVAGGSFEGEELKGKVLPIGADWLTIRSDQSIGMDVRAQLETDSGANIVMRHRGRWTIPKELWEKVMLGPDEDAVDPDAYRIRVSFTFETGSKSLGWLNNVIAIGVGVRTSYGIAYRVSVVC